MYNNGRKYIFSYAHAGKLFTHSVTLFIKNEIFKVKYECMLQSLCILKNVSRFDIVIRGAFNKCPDFFVQAFKIVVDS